MNVLNNSYFSNQELHTILKHIHNGLLEGGVFIVGSNQESGTVVHGGIYKKTDKGFLKIAESGNGAAIHEILVSL
jgi:chemotaxis methyl-accepting protein methylase